MVTCGVPTPPVVLAIAGTDSGGGAGIAADLATYAALGVHGTAVVTAVTAQDTTGVHAIHPVPLDVVVAQLDAVLGDLAPAVVKTGMLGTAEVAHLVAERVAERTTLLVVDPVLRATTGALLAGPELVEAYLSALLPVATVVTPNAAEARVLLGLAGDDATPARELAAPLADKLDGPVVLLTGGPDVTPGAAVAVTDATDGAVAAAPEVRALGACTSSRNAVPTVSGATALTWSSSRDAAATTASGAMAPTCTSTEEAAAPTPVDRAAADTASAEGPGGMPGAGAATCTDWLARPGEPPIAIEHPAVATTNDHGTGCTHASALAAHLALALGGDGGVSAADLEGAARKAAAFVTHQLSTSQQWQLGRGRGPIAHTHSSTHGHIHGHTHPPTNHSAPITEETA